MAVPSRLFGLVWLFFTALCWLVLAWFATHQSEFPAVLRRYSWSYFAFLAISLCLLVLWTVLLKHYVYQHRRTLILFFVSVGIAVLTAEAYCRLADPLGISYFSEMTRYNQDRIADPDLIVRHRRSWEATYQGVEVHFNEHGLRDNSIAQKADTEYRILVLGDSVTLGWGVDHEHTFTARLQHMLSTNLSRPVRVINAGVAGYNTVQEYAYLRTKGLDFEPDLILLVYNPNDIEPPALPGDSKMRLSFPNQSPPAVMQSLLEPSWLYRILVYAGRYGRLGVRSADDLDRHRYKLANGWKDSMHSLRAIAQLSTKHQIPLVVFYVRLWASSFNDALLEDVREVLGPVAVEDMGSWFPAEDKRMYMNSRIDSHLNPKGHEVIAEHMANYLLHEASRLPGLFPVSEAYADRSKPAPSKP